MADNAYNYQRLVLVIVASLIIIYFLTSFISSALDNEDKSSLIKIEPDKLDLMEYYNRVDPNGAYNFTMSNIFLRTENNFLQGFYFDS